MSIADLAQGRWLVLFGGRIVAAAVLVGAAGLVLASAVPAQSSEATYRAAHRRDPFVPPVADLPPGPKAELGLAGTPVAQVALKGIIRNPATGRFTALLLASDGKTHLGAIGQRVLDGRIIEVTADKVVFEQYVGPVWDVDEPPKVVELYLRGQK